MPGTKRRRTKHKTSYAESANSDSEVEFVTEVEKKKKIKEGKRPEKQLAAPSTPATPATGNSVQAFGHDKLPSVVPHQEGLQMCHQKRRPAPRKRQKKPVEGQVAQR